MTRTYTIYGLTLLSAFAVYWMFDVMSTVAVGFTRVPFSGFLAIIFSVLVIYNHIKTFSQDKKPALVTREVWK